MDSLHVCVDRVSLWHWNGVVPGGIIVGSVYLVNSEGLSGTNVGLLRRLAAALAQLGRPFVIGRDWQMPLST